ncbi:MAG: hypothetical protein L0I99_00905 [Micrococcaceae bacterium]|nr:hypothetical protein [Micrococcaceae bacterium]
MRPDQSLIEHVLEQLHEYGVQISPNKPTKELQPGEVLNADISHARGSTETQLVYLATGTLTEYYQLRTPISKDSRDVTVLAEYMNERSASAFRNLGIQYLDASGNAYFDFPGVHLDIRGRQPSESSFSPRTDAVAPINLLSPRRAQVVFALLCWPTLIQQPVRRIARAAGVSTGTAQATIKELENSGYVVGSALTHGDELLDMWLAAYSTGLGTKLSLAQLEGEISNFGTSPGDDELLLGGESAVTRWIKPTTLVLYTPKFDPTVAIRHRWKAGRSPNIYIRRAFWENPTDLAPRQTPLLLTYADLLASREPRQREVARLLEQDVRSIVH